MIFLAIISRVDRASTTETLGLGLIPSRFNSKTLKIDSHSFPARRSALI